MSSKKIDSLEARSLL